MNLEDIEQQSLAFLSQVGNPLVRVGVLFDHLARELDLGSFSQSDLVRFLDRHELFRVLDPVAPTDETVELLRSAGLLAERSVILESRIPTRDQVVAQIVAQLDRLGDALGSALREAREQANAAAEGQIREALERANVLRGKVVAYHASESKRER